MLNRKLLVVLFLYIGISLFAVEKLEIFTSILPQKFFVEEIGGERVTCSVLVGPGKSPATYQPTPSQIGKLSSSDILFTIGVPFEHAYLDKIIETLTDLKVKDTSLGIKKREIDEHHHEGEEEDHEDHEEESSDPHVWLSPVTAKTVSENIYNSLVELDPEGKEYYTKRYMALLASLDKVNSELHSILKPVEGKILFVYHPSFGYFADEYSLKQIAIETGGKEPTSRQLAHIIEEAQEEGVKLIVVQPEFSQKSAGIIANAIKGKVTTLNPLNPDYINNLKTMAEVIVNAYR